MNKEPAKTKCFWNQKRTHYFIKKKLKEKFKIKITSVEINKIWGEYIEEDIIKPLSVGTIVKINKASKIWVQATHIREHKRAMTLLKKGLMNKGGMIVEANINFDSSKYIYKIMYENIYWKHINKIYFKPHPSLSKAVNEGIKQNKLITRFNTL